MLRITLTLIEDQYADDAPDFLLETQCIVEVHTEFGDRAKGRVVSIDIRHLTAGAEE